MTTKAPKIKVSMFSYDNVNFVCGIQHCQFSLSFSVGLWSCEWKTRLKKHICNSVPVESKCFNETLEMQHHLTRCIGLDLLAVLGRRMPGPLKMKMAVIGMEMRWQRQKKRMQIARFFPACMLGPHCCPVHKCSRYARYVSSGFSPAAPLKDSCWVTWLTSHHHVVSASFVFSATQGFLGRHPQ